MLHQEDILCAPDITGETSKLLALLRLLDDDSPVVRGAVTAELAGYGTLLADEMRRLPVQPDEMDWELLRRVTGDQYRRRLRLMWPRWPKLIGETSRLEGALTLLAEFQNGPRWRPPLNESLDALADEFMGRNGEKSPRELAAFLFREKGLRGAQEPVFHSDHSNLAYVLETGLGLPVSLVCIYLLVGARCGLDIRACNWPRHFLARYTDETGMVIVDCFNGGSVVNSEMFLSMQGPSREAAEAVLFFDVEATAVVMRVLGNLIRAYRHENDLENDLFAVELMRNVETMLQSGVLC